MASTVGDNISSKDSSCFCLAVSNKELRCFTQNEGKAIFALARCPQRMKSCEVDCCLLLLLLVVAINNCNSCCYCVNEEEEVDHCDGNGRGVIFG